MANLSTFALAATGVTRLADKQTQAFTAVVNATKGTSWSLPGYDVKILDTAETRPKARGWAQSMLAAQDVPKRNDLMAVVMVNASDRAGEALVPAIFEDGDLPSLMWIAGCLGVRPDDVWFGSGRYPF